MRDECAIGGNYSAFLPRSCTVKMVVAQSINCGSFAGSVVAVWRMRPLLWIRLGISQYSHWLNSVSM